MILAGVRLLVVAVALAVAAGPRSAVAQSAGGDIEEYRTLVARAAEQFRDGEFAAARRSFLAAYDIHPEPVLLYNVAGTFRREGKLRQAIEYYERFLDRAPRDHERRSKARKYIDDLRETLEGGDARPPDDYGDDDEEDFDSADLLRDTDDDRSARRGSGRRIDRGSSPDRVGRRGRWAGIALGITGGLLLSVAIQQQLDASSTADDIANLPPGTPWDDDLDRRYADSQSAERRAKVLAVLGGAALITGAVLYFAGERQRRAARKRHRGDLAQFRLGNRSVAILPTAGQQGAGLRLRVDF
jgi:hypothetical protein